MEALQAQRLDIGLGSLHHNSHISAPGPGLHCIRSPSSDRAVFAAGVPFSWNGWEEFYIGIDIDNIGPVCAGDKRGAFLAALAGAGPARILFSGLCASVALVWGGPIWCGLR